MGAAELFTLVVAVGANNFAAALALGAQGYTYRWRRIAGMFGAMEFVVPLLGIWLGRQASRMVGDVAEWLAPVVLVAFGAWVATSPLRGRGAAHRVGARATTWTGLIMLSVAMSIENVVIGFSLGFREVNALLIAGAIGVAAVVFSIGGLFLGRSSRGAMGTVATVSSGVLLIGIGVSMALGVF